LIHDFSLATLKSDHVQVLYAQSRASDPGSLVVRQGKGLGAELGSFVDARNASLTMERYLKTKLRSLVFGPHYTIASSKSFSQTGINMFGLQLLDQPPTIITNQLGWAGPTQLGPAQYIIIIY
jgi:hypothetical protein